MKASSFLCYKLEFMGEMRASGGKLFGKKLGKNSPDFFGVLLGCRRIFHFASLVKKIPHCRFYIARVLNPRQFI